MKLTNPQADSQPAPAEEEEGWHRRGRSALTIPIERLFSAVTTSTSRPTQALRDVTSKRTSCQYSSCLSASA